MSVKLLRIEFDGINIFADKRLEIDFVAEKNVRESSVVANEVSHLFSSTYSLNTIALTGVNASGKTTILKLIEHFMHVYLHYGSINKKMVIDDEEGWIENLFADELIVTAYFASDKIIYCIESHIGKNADDPRGPVVFTEEIFYKRPVRANITRAEVFKKGRDALIRNQSDTSSFLPNDLSFFYNVLRTDGLITKADYINSLTVRTNINLAYIEELKEAPIELVNYLDSSIEYIEIDKEPESKDVTLKFFNKEPIKTRTDKIHSFLSSGTIRGIAMYTQAIKALKTGGYLIIDEIENHMNKLLVQQLISHFNSTLNENGATLIFTTHYVELIDFVPRNDGVYLLEKDKDIELVKFSDTEYKRSDIKKSNVILSGELNTTPDFGDYALWREKAKALIMEDE